MKKMVCLWLSLAGLAFSQCTSRPIADVTGDCVVDLNDLSLLAGQWLIDCQTNPANENCLSIPTHFNTGDLVITEIMVNPDVVPDAQGEWFEVTNITNQTVNLAGLQIIDLKTNGHVISENLFLPPHSRAVLANNNNPLENGHLPVDYCYQDFSLNNDQDEIILVSAYGRHIDSVLYDTTSWPITPGKSMGLSSVFTDYISNDNPAYWCESTSVYGDGDLGTPGATNDSCGSAQEGILVISEIMIDPAAVGDVNGEYIELYNASSTTIDLQGFRLTGDGADGFTIDQSLTVQPGKYLLLGTNPDTQSNGGLTLDYQYNYSSLILNNSGDSILIMSGMTVIDRVDYTSAWPYTSGVAMSLNPEYLNAADNDDKNNWCLATSPYGAGDLGTPGQANDSCNNTIQIAPGDLVITEIMYNPNAVTDSSGEWFEILNTTDHELNLEGLIIRDAGSDHFTIIGPLPIQPGEYIVFGINADPAVNGNVSVDYRYSSMSLSNTNDEIIILNETTVIDQVYYNWDSFPHPLPGMALSLGSPIPNATDNDLGSKLVWRDK